MMTTTRREPAGGRRPRHDGMRSCVGCGQRVDSARARTELIRLVFVPGDDEVTVVPDVTGTAPGRGAWLHTRLGCLHQAAKKGLARAAKARVRVDANELAGQIAGQARRRAAGLLAAAKRSRHAAIGATAVAEGWRAGELALVLVARDAGHVTRLSELEAARAAGAVMAFGTKASLGEAFGRGDVAVAGVDDDGMARALRHAIALAETFDVVAGAGTASGGDDG